MGWSTKGTPAIFEWGTAAKDKVDAEEVGGWRASGWREQPVGGRAISTSDSARRETDGQARWCGEGGKQRCVHVPFWLLAGPNERARGRGEARGRRG